MNQYKYITVTDEFTRVHIPAANGYYRRDWWHDLFSVDDALALALEVRDKMVLGIEGYAALRDLKWNERTGI